MKPSNNDKWYVNDDGYLCDEMGECVDIQTEAERIVKAVNTHDRAKDELVNILRCYERDNVDERRNNTGVNIHLTHTCAARIKALLTDMEG